LLLGTPNTVIGIIEMLKVVAALIMRSLTSLLFFAMPQGSRDRAAHVDVSSRRIDKRLLGGNCMV
jgi:hypothetical protein